MNDFTDENVLNDVLNVLKKDPNNSLTTVAASFIDEDEAPKPEPTAIKPTFDIEQEYKNLLLKLGDSLKNNSNILEEAALMVKTAGDEKTLEAYASVAKSNAELLRTLSGVLAERERLRVQETLKREDIAAKKEIAAQKDIVPKLGTGTTNIQNNYILKSSREEMFKALFGKDDEKDKMMNKILENNDETIKVIDV